MQQSFGIDGGPLRMAVPLFLRAHGSSAAALRHNGALQLLGLPPLHGLGHQGLVWCHAQNLQRRRPMMRRIGMQTYPAVRRLVIASNGIPNRWQLPALRANRTAEPEGS